MNMIPLFWPNIYKEEFIRELEDTFSTRWIGEGPKVKQFENEFCKKFNYEYCLGLNSGTAGLQLAYSLVDIKEGDHVLTTVFTCTATNLPLIHIKANLEFVDIDINTLTISYEDLKNKIRKDTKAIVIVSLGGIEVDSRIYDLAKSLNIPVILDACQSLGVGYQNADYIVYSFQAIKHFTTGDGGALILKNKDDYIRAKKLRWFGIDREAKIKNNWKCLKSNREMCMDIHQPGYKLHMNDISASLGLVGLKYTDQALEYRKNIAKLYENKLKCKTISGGSYWLFCIIVNDSDKIKNKIRECGIECDQAQLRNDIFTCFGEKRLDLPNMNKIEHKYLYIPIHCNLTEKDINYIIENVNKCIE